MGSPSRKVMKNKDHLTYQSLASKWVARRAMTDRGGLTGSLWWDYFVLFPTTGSFFVSSLTLSVWHLLAAKYQLLSWGLREAEEQQQNMNNIHHSAGTTKHKNQNNNDYCLWDQWAFKQIPSVLFVTLRGTFLIFQKHTWAKSCVFNYTRLTPNGVTLLFLPATDMAFQKESQDEI